jgi:hypothetical protein
MSRRFPPLAPFGGEGLKGNAAINQDRRKNEFAIPVLNTYLLAWYRVHSLPIIDEAKQPEPLKRAKRKYRVSY